MNICRYKIWPNNTHPPVYEQLSFSVTTRAIWPSCWTNEHAVFQWEGRTSTYNKNHMDTDQSAHSISKHNKNHMQQQQSKCRTSRHNKSHMATDQWLCNISRHNKNCMLLNSATQYWQALLVFLVIFKLTVRLFAKMDFKNLKKILENGKNTGKVKDIKHFSRLYKMPLLNQYFRNVRN